MSALNPIESADKKLYYPVVGPWMDLHQRSCSDTPCSSKTLDQVLLIGDGVVQGIGALGVLLSLVIPETTTQSWYLIGNSELNLVPGSRDSAVGLTAQGRF